MLALVIMIVILSLVFWALCELVSALAGIIFVAVLAIFILKLAKTIFK